jgi:hypothetical protein
MSYGFGMFFKQVDSLEDVLDVMESVNKNMIQYSKEELEFQIPYVPTIRFPDISASKYSEYIDEYWLDSAFTLRYVYWKDENLLGLCGCRFPKKVEELFDTNIYFQNSIDQNYDFDLWSDKIKIFKRLKEEYKEKSPDQLLDDFTEMDDILNDVDYFRKSKLYEAVFKELALDDWLYERDNEKFKRFGINAVECMDKKMEIVLQLRHMKEHMELF